MKIIIGADFGGFELKNAVRDYLLKAGFEVEDINPSEPITYQDAACTVAKGVQSGKYERGIVLCGTGMGVSIIANKFRGVYAALCDSIYAAQRAVRINNTNVLCMGGFFTGKRLGCLIAEGWLNARFLEGLDPAEKEKCGKEFYAIPAVEEELGLE